MHPFSSLYFWVRISLILTSPTAIPGRNEERCTELILLHSSAAHSCSCATGSFAQWCYIYFSNTHCFFSLFSAIKSQSECVGDVRTVNKTTTCDIKEVRSVYSIKPEGCSKNTISLGLILKICFSWKAVQELSIFTQLL